MQNYTFADFLAGVLVFGLPILIICFMVFEMRPPKTEMANSWKFRTVVFLLLACIIPAWFITAPLFIYFAYRSYRAGKPPSAAILADEQGHAPTFAPVSPPFNLPALNSIPEPAPWPHETMRQLQDLETLLTNGKTTQEAFDSKILSIMRVVLNSPPEPRNDGGGEQSTANVSEVMRFRAAAALYIAITEKIFEVKIGYDLQGVQRLDHSIQVQHDQGTPINEAVLGVHGSYLGECIVRNFGGKWEKDIGSADGSVTWSVSVGNRFKWYPFAKVMKHWENGSDDSVLGFYGVIGPMQNHNFGDPTASKR